MTEADYIKALKMKYLFNGLNFIERQQSAALKKILDGHEFVENRGGGTKYVQYLVGAGRGGSSFHATTDSNGRAIRAGKKNYIEWTLLEKHLHEIMEVTDKSVLKTLNAPNPEALIATPDIEMATALGAIGRYMGTCLFGSGHGEICELSAASATALSGLTAGGNAVTIFPEVSACWKVRPGDRLFISALMVDGVINSQFYLDAVSATTASITLQCPAGSTPGPVAAGDYLTFGAELECIINPNLATAPVNKALAKPGGRVRIFHEAKDNEHNLSGIDGLIASFDNRRVTISISDVTAPSDIIRMCPKDDIRYFTLTSLSRIVRSIFGKNAYETMAPENVYRLFFENMDTIRGFGFNKVIKPCGVVAPSPQPPAAEAQHGRLLPQSGATPCPPAAPEAQHGRLLPQSGATPCPVTLPAAA